jgi:CRP/FNR family cyclic AMP-dependent transcriptional regulator
MVAIAPRWGVVGAWIDSDNGAICQSQASPVRIPAMGVAGVTPMALEQLIHAVTTLNADDAFRPRFDDKQWATLVSYMQPYQLRAGDLLIRYRDMDRNLYLIESGTVQVYLPDAGPGRRPVGILRAGAIVGEPSMFGETPRMAQVEAMSSVTAWLLTRPRFEELLSRRPEMGVELMRAIGAVMSERMRANLERGQPLA